MNNLHRVLVRQITKNIGSIDSIPAEYLALLTSVSATYDSFDEDKILVERSLDLSSKELSEYISLLKSTLDSTTDGVLVIDNNSKISICNKRFSDLWKIPEEIINTHDDKVLLDFVAPQLKNPDVFLNKVKELYDNPSQESYDTLEFLDGRIFDRYSKPQQIGEKIIGRVWDFRDVTDQKLAEATIIEKLAETEKLNHFMFDREIKMTELKQEISDLKKKLGEI